METIFVGKSSQNMQRLFTEMKKKKKFIPIRGKKNLNTINELLVHNFYAILLKH
jgi:hypothetical protein